MWYFSRIFHTWPFAVGGKSDRSADMSAQKHQSGTVLAFPGATASDVESEAAHWVAHLSSGEVTRSDMVDFELWRCASPDHERVFDELVAIWGGLDEMEPVLRAPSLARRRAGTPWLKALSSLAAAVCLSFVLFKAVTVWRFDYVTPAGEIQTAQMEDGSVITLNTDTAIDVDFSPEERLVRLERGEAFFEVARNPQRPFLVKAGVATVRVLGTGFAVRRENRRVTVTVEHGRVEVLSGNGSVEIVGGQRVDVGFYAFGDIQLVDSDSALAWRRGLYIAENEPLGNVLAELDRYDSARYMITSDELRARRINAVVRLDQTAAWLDALDQTPGVDVRRIGPVLMVSEGE